MPPRSCLSREARRHVEEAHLFYRRYEGCLNELKDPDAALIMLFYSVLHLVQAHAGQEAARPGGLPPPKLHTTRGEYVARHLGSIATRYLILQAASENARYDLVKRSAADVQQFHDQEFTQIRDYLAERRGIAWSETS